MSDNKINAQFMRTNPSPSGMSTTPNKTTNPGESQAEQNIKKLDQQKAQELMKLKVLKQQEVDETGKELEELQKDQTNKVQPQTKITHLQKVAEELPYVEVSGLGKYAEIVREHVEDIILGLDVAMRQTPGFVKTKGNASNLGGPVKFYGDSNRAVKAMMARLGGALRRDVAASEEISLKPVWKYPKDRVAKLVEDREEEKNQYLLRSRRDYGADKVAGSGFDFTEEADKIRSQINSGGDGGGGAAGGAVVPKRNHKLELLLNGKHWDHVPSFDELTKDDKEELNDHILIQLLRDGSLLADLVLQVEDKAAIFTPVGGISQAMGVDEGLAMLRRVLDKAKVASKTASVNKTARILRAFRLIIGDFDSDFKKRFDKFVRRELDSRNIDYKKTMNWGEVLDRAVYKYTKNPEQAKDIKSYILFEMIKQKEDGFFDKFRPGRQSSFFTYFWTFINSKALNAIKSKTLRDDHNVVDVGPQDGESLDMWETIPGDGSHEEDIVNEDLLDNVRRYVEMNDPYNPPVLLTLYNGLLDGSRLGEIGEQLGFSPSKTNYYLKKLRALVLEYARQNSGMETLHSLVEKVV